MRVEFTVEGRNVNEVRAAARHRLDDLGDVEWRHLTLDIRAAPGDPALWCGDVTATTSDVPIDEQDDLGFVLGDDD